MQPSPSWLKYPVMSDPDLDFAAVDEDRWDDLVALFEGRGGPHYCWCMAWRNLSAEAKTARGKDRKAALKAALCSRVDEKVPIGLLAYHEGSPIAWCSIAPRSSYRPLGGPDDGKVGDRPVWSLVCFFVKREFRGRKMTQRLIRAAVDYAGRSGAGVVEAYPVDPESPSYHFMGLVSVFERAGFERVARAGHVVTSCASRSPRSEPRLFIPAGHLYTGLVAKRVEGTRSRWRSRLAIST